MLEIFPVGNRAEFEQREDGDGIAGGLRAVIVFLHSQDQVRGVGRCLPKAAVVLVVKPREHRLSECQGEFEVLRIERGFVKVDHSGEQKGIGVEQLHFVPFPIAPAMVERASEPAPNPSGGGERAHADVRPVPLLGGVRGGFCRGHPQLRLNERQILLRCGAIGPITQHGVSAGERAEHHAVPGREHFIVKMRPDPFAARLNYPLLRRFQQGLLRIGQFRFGHAQNVLVRERVGVAVIDEIALPGDAEVADGDLKFVRLQ